MAGIYCSKFLNIYPKLQSKEVPIFRVSMVSIMPGFKLGIYRRVKRFLPPGKLGRSDSKIGRCYSAKITTFSVSLEAN